MSIVASSTSTAAASLQSATAASTSSSSNSASSSSSSSTSKTSDTTLIASNFTNFLKLLTTQLKNQNPLDPLDTNQFTQQLVEFAQVEQEMKSNDQLSSLISLQQSAQSTTALNYVGATVVVDGTTSKLSNGSATWTLTASKPATATINIKDSAGKTVYTTKVTVNAGEQSFKWSGLDNNNVQCPDGNYTIDVTAVDASGQTTTVSTQVQATVDSVDISQSPPIFSINGQNYTADKIKKIVK